MEIESWEDPGQRVEVEPVGSGDGLAVKVFGGEVCETSVSHGAGLMQVGQVWEWGWGAV